MKKLMIAAAIAVLSFTSITAQDIKIGSKAGVNLATFTGDFEDIKTRTSFHLGGMVEIPVTDVFSIQPELLYSAQGAKSGFNANNVLKQDYLNIPVMAKYYVTEEISIEAGPQLGFLLSSKAEIDGQTDDIKDITKAIDIGLNLGAGYKLENGVNFGVRYYFGIADTNDDPDDPGKLKNSVFQISVGYFFN